MNDRITKKAEFIICERDGEKVTVEQLHQKILIVMDEVDRVCRKNNIPYALHAGSALGVINYKGFIPWDDDIDVMVAKEDYKRLVRALNEDLSSDFVFQCLENDRRYNPLIPNMKIRSKNTYLKEVNVLLPNRCKTGNGVYIDVIWFGNASENKFLDQFFRFIPRLLMPIIVFLDFFHINPLPFKYMVRGWASLYSNLFKKSKLTTQYIGYPWDIPGKENKFLKTDVFPFVDCEFEGRKYMTYHNAENVAHQWWGPNCTKRWNGTEWEETYPEAKRATKHVLDINLDSNKPYEEVVKERNKKV